MDAVCLGYLETFNKYGQSNGYHIKLFVDEQKTNLSFINLIHDYEENNLSDQIYPYNLSLYSLLTNESIIDVIFKEDNLSNIFNDVVHIDKGKRGLYFDKTQINVGEKLFYINDINVLFTFLKWLLLQNNDFDNFDFEIVFLKEKSPLDWLFGEDNNDEIQFSL
jgi:hypothetical protein